ncbi:unnamed protein product [Paramecium primaurelia]|uniref:Uncharacterized protein n=1 Tax=Paramecium primaurelia TaxID=5886 RepID=A0A8S1MAH8_PARPR|nr:unnamed protein product [Paramecium primaurelia]
MALFFLINLQHELIEIEIYLEVLLANESIENQKKLQFPQIIQFVN